MAFCGIAGCAVLASPMMSPTVYILCLVAVATIGVSHGALDYLKGRAVLKTLTGGTVRRFYLAYISLALLTLGCWYWSPAVLLTVFLGVAAYHFGKEDAACAVRPDQRHPWLAYVLKGSTVIMAPLYFSSDATEAIFQALHLSVAHVVTPTMALGGLGCAAMATWVLCRRASTQARFILVGDFASIVVLNYALPPLVAFSVYFCGLHSVRHCLELSHEMDERMTRGLIEFMKKAWPLTVVTAVCFAVIFSVLRGQFAVDESVHKVIFLGLASLTFPHIFLEYMFERRVLAGS